LIDKIVLEIARDAKTTHDLDCTIQDLSNCDISGIPETLDFDKCFQDVEMMTEEEARKLLSRKSDDLHSHTSQIVAPPAQSTATESQDKETNLEPAKHDDHLDKSPPQDEPVEAKSCTETSAISDATNSSSQINDSLVPPAPSRLSLSSGANKCKVRFSDEPAQIYDTHAVEDYDRRNDDIDPVAASAEYEIEKSRERQGIRMGDAGDEDNDDDAIREFRAVEKSCDEFLPENDNRSDGNERPIGCTGVSSRREQDENTMMNSISTAFCAEDSNILRQYSSGK